MALQRQTKEFYKMSTDSKLRHAELNGIIRESLTELTLLNAENEEKSSGFIRNPEGDLKMAFAVIAVIEDNKSIGMRKSAFGCDFLEDRSKKEPSDNAEKISIMRGLRIVDAGAMGVVSVVEKNRDKIIGKAVEMQCMSELVSRIDAIKAIF